MKITWKNVWSALKWVFGVMPSPSPLPGETEEEFNNRTIYWQAHR